MEAVERAGEIFICVTPLFVRPGFMRAKSGIASRNRDK
jgi:hypothetical protein